MRQIECLTIFNHQSKELVFKNDSEFGYEWVDLDWLSAHNWEFVQCFEIKDTADIRGSVSIFRKVEV